MEKDLIYPLIRGRDVKKWYVLFDRKERVIIPHNKKGYPYDEHELKIKYPLTYSYLSRYKQEFLKRSIKPFLGNKKKKPFYRVDNIGNYSFSIYKVVWKEVSARQQKFGFEVAVIGPKETKPIIPDHTVVMVACNSLEEAHYLAAILNSNIVSLACLYMVISGLENLNIPKFNPKNLLHQKLSQLSQRSHEIAKKIYEENREDLKEDLKKIEEEIDKTVANLYGVTDEELKEIRKCLTILKEGEIPEEEEESEEEQQIVLPKEDIEINVNPLLIEENKQQELTVSVQNNTDKPIKDVKLEVKLKSKSLLTKMIKEVKPNGSVSLKFTIPKLKSGEHELEINFSSQNVKFKESRKLFVKERKKAKKTESSLDREFEELLGG
ncbi:MAG: hypothetical protein J7L20_01100 [Thermoplasmata archaeon]|nr:hypothetical protein [Thermoplasmata archaeon]